MRNVPREVRLFTSWGAAQPGRRAGSLGDYISKADTAAEVAFFQFAKTQQPMTPENTNVVARTAAAWLKLDLDLDPTKSSAVDPNDPALLTYWQKALAWYHVATKPYPVKGADGLPVSEIGKQNAPTFDSLVNLGWGNVPWPAVLPLSSVAWKSLWPIDWLALAKAVYATYDTPPQPSSSPVLIPWDKYTQIPWLEVPWADIMWNYVPWSALDPSQPVTIDAVMAAAGTGSGYGGFDVKKGGTKERKPPKPGQAKGPQLPGVDPNINASLGPDADPIPDTSCPDGMIVMGACVKFSDIKPKKCPTGQTFRPGTQICVCPDGKRPFTTKDGHQMPCGYDDGGHDQTGVEEKKTGMSTTAKVGIGAGVAGTALAAWWFFGKKRKKKLRVAAPAPHARARVWPSSRLTGGTPQPQPQPRHKEKHPCHPSNKHKVKSAAPPPKAPSWRD